jgi:hypothetical protein
MIDNGTIQKLNENSLFHYTHWETALMYIIPKGEIKFSPLGKTNDPVEFSNYSPEVIANTPYNYEQIRKLLALSKELLEIRKDVKVASFVRNIKSKQPFSKGYLRTRMWSQYAEDSTGVCIVFDKNLLVNSVKRCLKNKIIFSGNIKYTDDLAIKEILRVRETITPNEFFNKYYRKFLFEKFKDYKDENEFRIAILDDNCIDPIYIRLDPKTIKYVIAGPKTVKEVTSVLRSECRKHQDCSLIKLKYINGEYFLSHYGI